MGLAEGTRFGRYEIGALVGAGGMGEVYRARDTSLRRDVAVKVLPERMSADGQRRRRFEKEARAAAELEHPNVVAVYDVGVQDESPYIVTELLDGATLSETLARGRLRRERAIEIAIQIARGAAAAHDKGIVHRDLKPANVFVCRDGRVKILDFGLAAHVGGEVPRGEDTTATESGIVVGTPAYMSPEQVRGKRVDARGDVFALGAILYEMLAGRRPFAGDSAVEVGHAILTDEPGPLDDPVLDRIVRRCLAKDAAARPSTAGDVAFALETFASLHPAIPAGPRRLGALMPIAAAGAVALLALGWVARRPRTPAPAPRYTRVTFHERHDGTARFTPDGRGVIYDGRSYDEPRRIYSASPGHPEARPLTQPDTGLVAVSATGDMLVRVSRPGTTVAIARAPLAGGEPRVLFDDVDDAAFSPDGRELAIVRRVDKQWRLEYPVGHALVTSPDKLLRPRVSPRGDEVAFRRVPYANSYGLEAGGDGSIELAGAGGELKVLSRGWNAVSGVAWTPDGKEVWVSGRRGALRTIHALGRDGGERLVLELPGWIAIQDIARDGRALIDVSDTRFGIAVLLPGQREEIHLGWYDQSVVRDITPDARFILFDECGDAHDEQCQGYVRGTDGAAAVHLGTDRTLALSPDGAWVLAASAGLSKLSLVPVGAGERRPLPAGSIAEYRSAGFFFADGRRIVFLAREAGRPGRVWIQDLAAGDPRPISDEGIVRLGRPASRGDVVLGCHPLMVCELIPVTGGAARRIAPLQRPGVALGLAEDGQSMIVGRSTNRRSGPDERRALWLVDLTTGSERLLRELPRHDSWNIIVFDYFSFTPDAAAYAYSYEQAHGNVYVVEGLR